MSSAETAAIQDKIQHIRANARPVTFAGVMGCLVALTGATVLIGWAADLPRLRGIVPGPIVMIPNSALAFTFGGLSLWLMRARPVPNRTRTVARVFGSVVLAIGSLTFLERMFGFDFGIDLLLFADKVRQYPYQPPGQMASNSTLCFMLAGLNLLLLSRDSEDATRWREVLATAGLAIATFALVGYLYGAKPLYTFDRAAGMALITAVSFALLHTGLLFARPYEGGVAYMTGNDVAGQVVRRLLLASLAVPIVAGALWIRGREQNLFTRESGVALMVIVTMAVLVTVVLQSARVLRRTDRAREALLVSERAATREAEAATLVKSQFLATMSHELRTPLSAIIGYSHLMSEGIGGTLSAQHAQQTERIQLSARHLLSLIDQILTLSRLDAGKEGLRARTVDVDELVRETVAIVEPLIDAKHLVFIVDAQSAGQIETDPDKARQILLNLLSNAVKFTDGGEVRLRVNRTPTHVVFEVSDTGMGISLEHQGRIFDAFWQVEMSHSREKFGTGLGLSVSLQLARLLGGSLTVSSVVGGGSTFRLELPA